GPPTVSAKDSLIGLLERGTHRRQRISALSTAALVRERLPYHLGSRPTQAFGEGPPVLHYVDRERNQVGYSEDIDQTSLINSIPQPVQGPWAGTTTGGRDREFSAGARISRG